MKTQAINPLSRRPRSRRLVIAVRGAAGTGKSVFASTLADTDLGRLCFFDTERKARLLPGSDGTRFDAIEVQHPDELPAFIDWALEGDGRQQGYGCYVLDSWAMYFARKHRESLQTLRSRTGNPLVQLSAEELAADQIVYQEVLRRLCIDSGSCVVITDQIAAKGKEEREENEMGQVLPMTSGGLEYFVDVMIELFVRVDGFETVRIARVIKSNSPDIPIGLELRNPTFADFLNRLGEGPNPDTVATIPALLEVPAPEEHLKPTLEALLMQAEAFGISQTDLVLASRHYCGTADLDRLSPEQIDGLLSRMVSRYAHNQSAAPATAEITQRNGRSRINGKATA